MSAYPDWFIERIRSITNKRPKIVAEHILEHGSVTTEELETLYGYKHAPRAARDLRELGIPLETIRVKSSEGRTIAAYRFGDLAAVRSDRLSGRSVFSKQFKQQLVLRYGEKCSICGGKFEARYLQIDHRIPYEVAGDQVNQERSVEDYQLLCGTCNRAKSWSCEHCVNWLERKQPEICLNCYWANPVSYLHVALRNIRRIDIVWEENEIESYEWLRDKAHELDETMPDYVKKVLKNNINPN